MIFSLPFRIFSLPFSRNAAFSPYFSKTSPHLHGSSSHSPHSEFRMYFSPLNFAPVIGTQPVAGVFVWRAAMLPFNSPQSTQSSTEFSLLCHSDDRREEESREHKVGCNVDAHEILRRSAPLDDKRWKRKKRLCETPCHSVVNKSN